MNMNIIIRHSLLRLLMNTTHRVLLVISSELYFKLRPSSPNGWQKRKCSLSAPLLRVTSPLSFLVFVVAQPRQVFLYTVSDIWISSKIYESSAIRSCYGK